MRRRHLIEAVKSSLWKRERITIRFADGDQKVDAVSFGGWGVHREGGRKGDKWSITHVPTGLALTHGLATQRYAKQLVKDMLERYPRLKDTENERQIRPYLRLALNLARKYQQGLIPDQGKMNVRSAPRASRVDTERMRHLAKMGDKEAKSELKRAQERSGKRKKKRPVGRISDIRPRIASAISAELPYIGRRSGKSGIFYGKRNHSRALSVGKNTVLANMYQVGAKQYRSLGGKPRIETSWVLWKSYPIKDITDEQLRDMIAWAKESVPTKDLRTKVRQELAQAMQDSPNESSYYEVVYG